MKVLFVCTGNLCRSPMAEALLREILAQRDCDDIAVSSAGTWAGQDHRASEGAAAVLRARGIDLDRHRSRPLDREELTAADVVVVMTSVHVREVLSIEPRIGRKLFLLKEIPELEDQAGSASAGLDALYGARRPEPRRSLDLDDPIGLPLMAYERCVNEIDTGVRALADRICPRAEARREAM